MSFKCIYCNSPATVNMLKYPGTESAETESYCAQHAQMQITAYYVEMLKQQTLRPKAPWLLPELTQPLAPEVFWRCEHHPSAIDNWAAKYQLPCSDPGAYVGCEHGCNLQPLRWHDNGFHQQPKAAA